MVLIFVYDYASVEVKTKSSRLMVSQYSVIDGTVIIMIAKL